MEYDKEIKRNLRFIIRHRRGYLKDLSREIGQMNVQRFANFGFINIGHTLKYETWSMTCLAKDYYIDTFGVFSYYWTKFFS